MSSLINWSSISISISIPISNFKTSFNWGNTITLVQHGDNDDGSATESKAIAELNACFDAEKIRQKTQELASFVEKCGIGYTYIDVNTDYEDGDSYFKYMVLDPRAAFVVRSSYYTDQRIIMNVTFRVDHAGNRYYTIFTKDRRFEVKNGFAPRRNDGTWDFGEGSNVKNPLGRLPFTEWIRCVDRTGCFERQIPDMDALNIEVSDFANAGAQDTQGMYWGNDFEFPKDASGNVQKPVSGQWIMTRTLANGTQPKIQPLQSSFDYSGVQQNIESKRNLILQKCYVPLQTDPGGGSTASAMSMSSGWTAAENAACKEEQIIRRAKMQIAKLELIAIQRSHHLPDDSPLKGLKLSDIAIKFTRLKTYDLGTKTNSMVAMLKAGINGRVAMQTVDLFPDVAQAWEDSKETIEKFQKSLFEKKEAPDTFGRNQSDSTDQTGNSPILDGMRTGGDDDAE